MIVPDRLGFACGLGAALAAPEPAQQLNKLLRGVLTTPPVPWQSEEQQLVRWVSERLDVANGDTNQLLALAQDMQVLLDNASSTEAVELLLELIVERERVLDLIRKLARGTITRTSFLSFVAEQRWPGSVRRRMSELSLTDLARVAKALEQRDIARLEVSLLA